MLTYDEVTFLRQHHPSMLLDQFSILVAIGFSGASLGLTLFMMWTVARSEAHLLVWSVGLVFIVVGVIFFGWIIERYNNAYLFWSFTFLTIGFGLLYLGSAKFCSDRMRLGTALSICAAGSLALSVSFGLGYSGIGTMVGNVVIGVLLALSGHQYWIARAESPVLMGVNAVCFFLASASFIACGYALLQQGQFALDARPANWAEDINAVVVIMGLTAVGTLSLTLHQARIAEQHKLNAMTDALTGLMNRRVLFEVWPDVVPPDTAVLLLDLDHFKTVNDRFGHDAGDQVLKRFSRLILDSVRSTDIVVRLGGEEFCIVLTGSSLELATAVANRIRLQMEMTTMRIGSRLIQTTVSVGLAYSEGSEAIQTLMSRADIALYEAKSSGRNRVEVDRLSLVA
ncbi:MULTISPECIES: GGDEF domain-containing protein [unclassified Beijerinckia]|uniref:GGDEF domain-containing protein n=1 Tax=unclassified Beijerinckia TaxID=2638183 RepID=UPI00089D67EB|nr:MULTISPECIES: GGDEF domain-containing protein [unclassified Beijerinckia]MDH7794673.1 diguanylate cyclase (GGDEF)-like protein [Beijerinckia sp. GAS462]SEB70724.1 diguanylate cyclase (GGDEF) domain-containing protein [Beijerinckia sp. 28-YEA-48]